MSSTKQGQNQSAKVIRQGSFLVIASLAVNVMNLAYRIPITRLWGDQGMGIYSDAYQIYTYFLVLASYGIPATMSKMISERLARKEYRNAQTVFKCAAKVVTVVGLVSMLIMMAFNKVIATAVYNNPLASRPIFFLGPTVLIVALTSVISGFFQGRTNMQPTSISVVVEGAIHAIVSVLLAYTLMGYGIDWSVTGGIFGRGMSSTWITISVPWRSWASVTGFIKDPARQKAKLLCRMKRSKKKKTSLRKCLS